MKRNLFISIVTIIVTIIGIIIYVALFKGKNNNDVSKENAIKNPVNEVQTEEIEYTSDVKDIAALKETNGDIYAWITIPGTEVDFPILQAEEDDYYLNHTVEKTEGLPGAIYTNQVSGTDFKVPNTIVYGHNMKNGSYFGQLHLYEDEEFFNNNREICIYLVDRKLTFEIIMASKFNDSYLPEAYLMENQVGVKQFLDELANYAPNDQSSHFFTGYDMGKYNQIITLSTCVKGVEDERYLVVGRLAKVESYQ